MSWMQNNRRKSKPESGSSNNRPKMCFGFREEISLGRKHKDLLFVPGSYTNYKNEEGLPYWQWIKHRFVDPNRPSSRSGGGEGGFMRSYFCTKVGTPNYSGECVSCDVSSPRTPKEKRDARVGGSGVIHWNVIDLDWWYRIPNAYEEGNFKWAQPTTPAEGARLENDGYERVFGRRMYLPFGPTHAAQFDDIVLKSVERMCRGCSEELGPESAYDGGLAPAVFTCGKCGGVVADLISADLTGDQIDDIAYGVSDVKCPHCGHSGIAETEYACTQCTTPTSTSLFDVVVPLSKFTSKTDANKTQTNIAVPVGKRIQFASSFKLPNGEALMKYDAVGNRMVNPLVAHLYEPYDFKGDLFALQFDPGYQIGVTEGGLTAQPFTPRAR